MPSIHDFGKGTDKNPNGNGSGSNGSNNNGQGPTNGGPIGSGSMPSGNTSPFGNDDPIADILIDYSELAKKGEFHPVLFREAQINQLLSILNTVNHPNALIVGDAGVGKTGIVEEVARLLYIKDPLATAMLPGYTIYELPISKLVAGKSYVGQLEQALSDVLDFASDPKNKAILFIDEIHQLMTTKDSTSEKISQMLKPALARKNIHFIGATTTQEATSIQKDPAFSRRWSTIIVPELTQDETIEVVKSMRSVFEKKHQVTLLDNIIAAAIPIADEYKQYGSHRPDTALTLIDRAMSDAHLRQQRVKSTPAYQQLANKNLPNPTLSEYHLKQSAMSLLAGSGKKVLDDAVKPLEENLKNNIIGQTNTKDELIKTVKRMSLLLTKNKKPTSFLFAGPTGTGKTEIVKQLADALFGSKDSMIYLNMSEYSHASSLTNITGSSEGYIGSDSKRELPFDSLESNPFQIILLDELEKADPVIVQYFMQALDEGKTKTNRNKFIDFSRSIIIATTNAGVEALSEKRVGFGVNGKTVADTATQTDIINALKDNFKIEIINRFDHVIGFNSLSKEEYTQVLAVKYNKLIDEAIQNRPDLSFNPVSIDIDSATTIDKLVELADESYDPQLNGRPAERTMKQYIEDFILDNSQATQFTLL